MGSTVSEKYVRFSRTVQVNRSKVKRFYLTPNETVQLQINATYCVYCRVYRVQSCLQGCWTLFLYSKIAVVSFFCVSVGDTIFT